MSRARIALVACMVITAVVFAATGYWSGAGTLAGMALVSAVVQALSGRLSEPGIDITQFRVDAPQNPSVRSGEATARTIDPKWFAPVMVGVVLCWLGAVLFVSVDVFDLSRWAVIAAGVAVVPISFIVPAVMIRRFPEERDQQ